MSRVPSSPSEISSCERTPADSLLERLRRITGLTEAELPPPPRESPDPGPPPVDRLMEWLGDVTSSLAALGLALGAALALAGFWIWEHTLEGRVYSRSWQKRMAERKAHRITVASFRAEPATPPAPEQEKKEATALTDEPEKPAEFREVIARVAKPALPRPRTRRKAVVMTAVVLAAAPALLLVPGVRYYFTGLLGWGNATVAVGESGWLFSRAETLPGAVNTSAMLETAAALRTGGAKLVFVSVPAKASVYPNKREASAGDALARPAHLAPTMQKLTESGAAVLDIGPVLHALKSGENGDTVFRPQSSHWSPRAVEKAAASVAAFVQQQPGYASLPLRPFQPTLTRVSLTAPGDDLAAAFDSRHYREAHPPQPLHLIRLLDPAGKPLAADPASPVLLIGGDDVRLYDDPALTPPPAEVPAGQQLSAGFAQYLALYLSSPLDVRTASLSTAAAREWLGAASPPDRSAKKFIIWLVPDAELAP